MVPLTLTPPCSHIQPLAAMPLAHLIGSQLGINTQIIQYLGGFHWRRRGATNGSSYSRDYHRDGIFTVRSNSKTKHPSTKHVIYVRLYWRDLRLAFGRYWNIGRTPGWFPLAAARSQRVSADASMFNPPSCTTNVQNAVYISYMYIYIYV